MCAGIQLSRNHGYDRYGVFGPEVQVAFPALFFWAHFRKRNVFAADSCFQLLYSPTLSFRFEASFTHLPFLHFQL